MLTAENKKTGTATLKKGLAQMLKGGVIMDVVTADEAKIAEADATMKIYLEKSVGIGEHPQHIDEIDKLIETIANAEEKLEVLEEFREQKGEE